MTATANQKAFNKAYLGLKSQDFLMSADEDGICFYRRAGMKCAAGWLIPDSKYRDSWEGHGVSTLPVSLFRGIDRYVLIALQNAHDLARSKADMQRRLQEVAAQFDLTVPA